jgi:hypothetical protein
MTPNAHLAPTELVRPPPIGCIVEVRTRYLGGWTNGFQVAGYVEEGCRIRRTSDGSVFNEVFPWSDVRRSSSVRDVA